MKLFFISLSSFELYEDDDSSDFMWADNWILSRRNNINNNEVRERERARLRAPVLIAHHQKNKTRMKKKPRYFFLLLIIYLDLSRREDRQASELQLRQFSIPYCSSLLISFHLRTILCCSGTFSSSSVRFFPLLLVRLNGKADCASG